MSHMTPASPGFQRPSDYFGALKIEKLDENELPDPKLTLLFEECFGKKFQVLNFIDEPDMKIHANNVPSDEAIAHQKQELLMQKQQIQQQ